MHYSFIFRIFTSIGLLILISLGPTVEQVFATAMYRSEARVGLTLTGIRDAQGNQLTTLPVGFTINGAGDLDAPVTRMQGNAEAIALSDIQSSTGEVPTGIGNDFPDTGLNDTLTATSFASGSAQGSSLSFAEIGPDVGFEFQRQTPETLGTSYQADFLLEYSLFASSEVLDPTTEFSTSFANVFLFGADGRGQNPVFQDLGTAVSNNETFQALDFSALANHPEEPIREFVENSAELFAGFPNVVFPVNTFSTGGNQMLPISIELPAQNSFVSVEAVLVTGGLAVTGEQLTNFLQDGGIGPDGNGGGGGTGAPIPEPSTVILFGSGFAGLVAWRMRRRRG